MSSLRAFKSIDRLNSMFEDAAMEELGYSPFKEALGGTNPSASSNKREKTRGGKSNRIRRFSDDQTRSLERIFESETRLEPQKKVEVARELGLQPRQVAIWFQNKRARWKSKRLEHECAMLRADYTHLASRLESLKNEKCALISQLEKLKVLAGNAGAAATTSTDGDVQSGEEDETVQLKMDPAPPPAAAAVATPTPPLSDDESSIGAAAWFLGISEETDRDWDRHHHHHRQEESQSLMISMDMVDRGSSLTSTCHGPSLGLDSDDLLDPGSPDQWWDFWS